MKNKLILFLILAVLSFSCLSETPVPEVDENFGRNILSRVTAFTDGLHLVYEFSYEASLSPTRWHFSDGVILDGLTVHRVFTDTGVITAEVESADGELLSRFDMYVEGAEYSNDMHFITLNNKEDVFVLKGKITKVTGAEFSDIQKVSSASEYGIYFIGREGYYLIETVVPETGEENVYDLFISPVPSVHMDRPDMDWYRTQWRTTTTSNCGPTVVSMSLAWAAGLDVPVHEVRDQMGWVGSGAVNLEQMKAILDSYNVHSFIAKVSSPAEMFAFLEQGYILGIAYDMAGISFTENADENFIGQYYVDHGGHYLTLKGYSTDHKYFIIYDPIPSNWTDNAERYSDGISMYGRNRYYDADELFAAMNRKAVLVIRKNQ